MTPFLQERRVLRFRAAGFWRRVAGGIVDGTLLATVMTALLWLMWVTSWPIHTEVQHFGIDFLLELLLGNTVGGLVAGVTLLLAAQGYFVALHTLRGRTLGEQIVGTRLVTRRGVAPGVWRSLARAWGSLLGFACFGVGMVWIAFDREKRGFGDFCAGSYSVIEASTSRAPAPWSFGASV